MSLPPASLALAHEPLLVGGGAETVGKSKRGKGGNGLSSQRLLSCSLAKGWAPFPCQRLGLGQCRFTLTPGSSVIPWEPLGTQVPQCKIYTGFFFFFNLKNL